MKNNLDAFLIIIFLIFVMLVTPKGESKHIGGAATSTGLFSNSALSRVEPSFQSLEGSTKVNVTISSGNAPYTYQPYQEYITIENWGEDQVNITGWQLKNGKDKRTYRVGSGLQRFSADTAAIPTTSEGDVILKSGERALVITGSMGIQTPYKITSFKEDKCTGYIEALPDYTFEPPLQQSCPDPGNEPGVENLDRECRVFIERLSPCRTPLFGQLDEFGYRCENCTENQVILSGSCASFVKEHFNYQGCLAYHSTDPEFENRTWRIFLGRSWEMWAEDYETIELFDRFNN